MLVSERPLPGGHELFLKIRELGDKFQAAPVRIFRSRFSISRGSDVALFCNWVGFAQFPRHLTSFSEQFFFHPCVGPKAASRNTSKHQVSMHQVAKFKQNLKSRIKWYSPVISNDINGQRLQPQVLTGKLDASLSEKVGSDHCFQISDGWWLLQRLSYWCYCHWSWGAILTTCVGKRASGSSLSGNIASLQNLTNPYNTLQHKPLQSVRSRRAFSLALSGFDSNRLSRAEVMCILVICKETLPGQTAPLVTRSLQTHRTTGLCPTS